ncbi:MAG: response regulator [Verrucomicrobia bacterium]|nr:response regulator [Deltaproteobacteria bacterium]
MNKKKILLVDDVRLFLEQQMGLLSRDDFDVLLAHDGIEALKTVREEMPDIVFMDLYMPGMDGDRCCHLIKSDEKLRHIPIIMVTQGAKDEDFERCWQAGCDDVIAKPINRYYFLAVAKRHLNVQMRRVPRYEASLRVEFHSGTEPDRVLSNYCVNLSTGGIFIETTELLQIDSSLNIQFTLPEEGKIIKCSGRVAWINHPESMKNPNLPIGMGLQFSNLTLDDLDSIRKFIKDQTLQPEW